MKLGYLQVNTAKNQAERMLRIADCDSGGAYSFLAGLRAQQARQGWLGLARIGHGWPSAAVRKEPAHWQSCLEAVSAGGRNKQQSAASYQRSFSHVLETSRQTEIYKIESVSII